MRHGWSVVKARRGWRFTVYQHGHDRRRTAGWRPSRRWAHAAVRRADARMCQ